VSSSLISERIIGMNVRILDILVTFRVFGVLGTLSSVSSLSSVSKVKAATGDRGIKPSEMGV